VDEEAEEGSMKNEKPIKVIAGTSRKHRTETRVFARNIHETFCAEKGCPYFGKHAAQGLCHSETTMEGLDCWDYVDAAIKGGDEYVKSTREIWVRLRRRRGLPAHGRAYEQYLEGQLACAWTSAISTTDELVRLRREVAVLRAKLGKIQ